MEFCPQGKSSVCQTGQGAPSTDRSSPRVGPGFRDLGLYRLEGLTPAAGGLFAQILRWSETAQTLEKTLADTA